MTIVTEQDYDALRELGKKLHIPTPEMSWSFKVEAQDGTVSHEHDERGHSWVRNAYNMLVSQMCAIGAGDNTYGAGLISVKTVAAAVKGSTSKDPLASSGSFSPEAGGYGYCGAGSDQTRGIVVGTGLAAFDFEQFKLDAQITHGSAAGQFMYQTYNAIVRSYVAETKTYSVTHSRCFNNNSAADVTVGEVAIYDYMVCSANNGAYPVMVTRDILGTPVTVPPASKLTITYTVAVAFPA